MNIPNYQSQSAGPKTSGLDAANTGIVGGGPIVQGLGNAAQSMLVYAHYQQQVEQAKQVNMASGHLTRLSNLFDTTWESMRIAQLNPEKTPVDPQVRFAEFDKFMTDQVAETMALPEIKDNPFAAQYLSTHIRPVLHGRTQASIKETLDEARAVASVDSDAMLAEWKRTAINDPAGPNSAAAHATAHIRGIAQSGLEKNPSAKMKSWHDDVNFGLAALLITKDPTAYLTAIDTGAFPTKETGKDVRWGMVRWDQLTDKFPTLHEIATNKLSRTSEADKRAREAKQSSAMKSLTDGIFGTVDPTTKKVTPPADMSYQLSTMKPDLDAEKYESMKALNQRMKDARRGDVTEYQKRKSVAVQAEMLGKAERAMFDPAMLAQINEDVVVGYVTAGRLLPDDAPAVYTAIKQARLHHDSADSSTKQAESQANKFLTVFKPPLMDTSQVIILDTNERDMKQAFAAWRIKNPTATPSEIHAAAGTIRVAGEERILAAQKLDVDELNQVLYSQEQHMPDGLVKGDHELDPAMRQMLEETNPELKALFAIHDKRRKRFEYKHREATIDVETKAKNAKR